MDVDNCKNELIKHGLKVTPQRLIILEAVLELNNHPTAEKIISYIKESHPNVAIGTIYKTLELFVNKGIIKKITTEKDVMRYDGIVEKHHHLYSMEDEEIIDYHDMHLSNLIEDYFRNKKIPGFDIEEVKLQIVGKFTKD
jgi:Fur family transcriptional regulator, peroxide stress response regulator